MHWLSPQRLAQDVPHYDTTMVYFSACCLFSARMYAIEGSEPGSRLLCLTASTCSLRRRGQLQFLDAPLESQHTLVDHEDT